MYVYMYACMGVCMYVCVNVCITKTKIRGRLSFALPHPR